MRHDRFIFCTVLVAIQSFSIAYSEKIETDIKEVRASSVWRKVQDQAKDTVVQIFNYTAEFNWFEPYKSPRQSGCTGSGFFIDEKGHILTNFHVVEEGASTKIQIQIGRAHV